MRLDNISEVRKELKSLKADMIEYVNELRIPGRGILKKSKTLNKILICHPRILV